MIVYPPKGRASQSISFMGCLPLPPYPTRGVRRGKRWFDIAASCQYDTEEGGRPHDLHNDKRPSHRAYRTLGGTTPTTHTRPTTCPASGTGVERGGHASERVASKYKHGSRGWFGCVSMILPQVHLRKPCYDFSFL